MNAFGRMTPRLVMICLCTIASSAVAQADPIDAVWKPQRVSFSLSGGSTSYACDELARRISNILVVLGAHERIRVDRRNCSNAGIDLDITFMSPIEATSENVRALTTFSTEDQLVARLRGIELPTAEDVQWFRAEWQKVSLSHDPRLHLTAGDCELLEQVRRQLLPQLMVRDVSKRLVCVPGHLASKPPRLTVSALVASTQ